MPFTFTAFPAHCMYPVLSSFRDWQYHHTTTVIYPLLVTSIYVKCSEKASDVPNLFPSLNTTKK